MWLIYLYRYGSVKSAHRRTGKIKGIERILGTVDQIQESLIEVTSGQAKYEHHHRAIVWRCPRLPKEGQGNLNDFTNVSQLQKNKILFQRCLYNSSTCCKNGFDKL